MAKKNKLLVLLLFISQVSQSLFAQDFNDYTTLKSSGKIPQEFLTTSLSKTKEQTGKEKSEKDKKKFIRQSNYEIDRLLLSGNVLFGDPISNYLSQILDVLLKDEPGIRAQVRVYTIQSPFVNAFATDRGTILVTTGLVARLSNEAEMAFVLSHELTHFIKQHAMDGFTEKKLNAKKFKQSNSYDAIVKNSFYSKKLELEADTEGFRLFNKSPYRNANAIEVMNLLEKAGKHGQEMPLNVEDFCQGAIPYDELIATRLLYVRQDKQEKTKEEETKQEETKQEETKEEELVPIEEEYLKNNPEKAEEVKKERQEKEAEENEKLSTHPNIGTRIKNLDSLMSSAASNQSVKKNFVVGTEESFQHIKKIANYELVSIYLSKEMFYEALVQSHALLKSGHNSRYLRRAVAHSLYALSKFSYKEIEVGTTHEISGNNFDTLGSQQLNLLGLSYLQAYAANFEQSELRAYMWDLFIDQQGAYQDLLKKENPAQSEVAAKKFLAQLLAWQETQSVYDKVSAYTKELDDFEDFLKSNKGFAYKERFHKLEKTNNWSLGIDSLLIVSPQYYKFDGTRKRGLNYGNSEKEQVKLTDYIQTGADDAGLHVKVFDNNHLGEGEIEKYNEGNELKKWYAEKNLQAVDILPWNHSEVLKIKKKYGINHLASIGIIGYSESKLGEIGYIFGFYYYSIYAVIYAAIAPPLAPLLVMRMVRPARKGYLQSTVFDISGNRQVFTFSIANDTKMNQEQIAAQIGDVLGLIKAPRKKLRK